MHSVLSASRRAIAGILALCAVGFAGAQPAPPADSNVYSGGAEVRPAAPVRGDFTALGGKVVVEQPIGGDATLGGGSVQVRAPIGDDLRAAGGDVEIDAAVGGELFATGANITLGPAASVAAGARLHGSSVRMQGRIAGALEATATRITIDGEVVGDAHLEADEIVLGPKARIGGNLSYESPGELKKSDGATVAGATTRSEPQPPPAADRPNRHHSTSMRIVPGIGSAMSFLGLLAVAALFLLVAPAFGAQAAQRVRTSPWLALGIGFGVLVATPVLAVLLFITLLGIPLSIAVMAVYPALLLAGFTVGVLFVARLLPAALGKPAADRYGAALGWFAIALVLVLLAGWLPWVGGYLAGIVLVAGLGAFVLEVAGRMRGRQR